MDITGLFLIVNIKFLTYLGSKKGTIIAIFD